MVESAPTESRLLSPNKANPIAAATSASKPIGGVRVARRGVAICEGMAIAASVRPATTSAPRSPGRQPAKERKMNLGRPARRGAAKFSLLDPVTSSATETLPIVLRTYALEARKISPQRLFRTKSTARRDPLGGQAGVGEQLTGRLDAQPLDRARRRQARRVAITAQERSLA